MTLPKKKSRPITVDEMNFRYAISTSRIDDDSNFLLNLTVQTASGEGSLLKIEGMITRDFWLDFSELSNYSKEDYPMLYPSDISKIIKLALKNGWKPYKRGKPYILKLDNSFITNYIIN